MSRQKIELKLTDTESIHFKNPLYCYMFKVDDTKYDVWHDKLALRASGTTPTSACQLIKDLFIELATDIAHKSKYASLSQKEREKLDIINSVCSFR